MIQIAIHRRWLGERPTELTEGRRRLIGPQMSLLDDQGTEASIKEPVRAARIDVKAGSDIARLRARRT